MKIKKILNFALLAGLLGVMLSSCSTYSLLYDQVYNATELEEFKTFRIVAPEDGSLPPGMTSETYYYITTALTQQMEARGYTPDPTSELLVNIGLTVRKDLVNVPYTQTVQTGGSYVPTPPPPPAHNGMVPYFMYPRYQYIPHYSTYTQWVPTLYREGVLTIDFVNLASKTPLYTASVGTLLDNGDSQLSTQSGIDQAVKVLFSKYPVAIPKK